MPDMKKIYKEEIVPAIKESRGLKNTLQVPCLKKIVINCGISTKSEKEVLNEAKEHIGAITGQLAVSRKSKKDIANFKLRSGVPVGVSVTLRGGKMFDFYDRLVHVALPRVRDFRGVSRKSFDGSGNYNLGIKDISIFPEIDLDKLKHALGLNITIVTSAGDDEGALDLLQRMSMPFAIVKQESLDG